MIEMTEDEFETIYRALQASVNQNTEDQVLDVLQAEDEAWEVIQRVDNRRPIMTSGQISFSELDS